jgi:hypothetical protein
MSIIQLLSLDSCAHIVRFPSYKRQEVGAFRGMPQPGQDFKYAWLDFERKAVL